MIDDIYRFYRQKREIHSAKLKRLKRLVYHIGTLRLVLIVGMIAVIWVLHEKDWSILMAIAGMCACCFLFLIVYHNKLHEKSSFEEGLIWLFDNELKALDYDFSAFDGASEQVDAQHAFSMDLDLFGERSLFQLINRTVTRMGKETLVNRMKRPLTDKKKIVLHQEGVQEMKALTDFRLRFYVVGELASKEKQDLNDLFSADNHSRLSKSRIISLLLLIVPALWIVLTAGVIFQLIPPDILGCYFGASYLIANLAFKRIGIVFSSLSRTEKILKTYSDLLCQVECAQFHSTILKTYQSLLTEKSSEEATNTSARKQSASYAIKKLSHTIGALDQRFSLMGVILNILYMRDARQAIKLEQWKRNYSGRLSGWFDTLGIFDTFCSFGTYAFNHPDYTYPTLSETYFEMKGKSLGHPLIHRDSCVRNDITIPKSNYFLIVTGANMAGKSTFLRTVGVNYLLSCMGLPACAESLTVFPAQLVTSLRTSDSLVSNESYFFAELLRLKMIIDRLNAGEKLLIILDEILKGTNSIDKQKGSIALMKQLIHKNTCGIIATHDLLLGSLSDIFPENVKNKRFEAEINGNELTFTYQIRDGIAQNMNATFLMKRMGIFDNE